AGADVQGPLGHLDVDGGGLDRQGGGLLLGDDEVVPGDVAGGALVADLVPAVVHGGQDVHGGPVVQLGEDLAGGAGLGPDPEGGALGVHGAGDSQGWGDHGGDQQGAGGGADGA